jgi:PAS domain S-box-containing protein
MVRAVLATLRVGRWIGAYRSFPITPSIGDAGLEDASKPLVWRLAADLVPFAVLILDDAGHVLDANLTAVKLTGVERTHLRRRPLTDLVEPADRRRAAIMSQQPLQRRQGWRLGIRTPTSSAIVAFDCWPVRIGEEEGLVLIGRQPQGGRDRTEPSTAYLAEQAELGDGGPVPT